MEIIACRIGLAGRQFDWEREAFQIVYVQGVVWQFVLACGNSARFAFLTAASTTVTRSSFHEGRQPKPRGWIRVMSKGTRQEDNLCQWVHRFRSLS
jgi:hypothetical protein